jgi:hypothetical protein
MSLTAVFAGLKDNLSLRLGGGNPDMYRGNWYMDRDLDAFLPVVAAEKTPEGGTAYTAQILVLPDIPAFSGKEAMNEAIQRLKAHGLEDFDPYVVGARALPAGATAADAVAALRRLNAECAQGKVALGDGNAAHYVGLYSGTPHPVMGLLKEGRAVQITSADAGAAPDAPRRPAGPGAG